MTEKSWVHPWSHRHWSASRNLYGWYSELNHKRNGHPYKTPQPCYVLRTITESNTTPVTS